MTDDEIGLLNNVAANDWDSLPWMVYADAAEEAGKAELAEYVRAQAHLMSCPARLLRNCPVCSDCNNRVLELIKDQAVFEQITEVAAVIESSTALRDDY